MVAKTDQKARLLDLVTGVLELTRDGKRDVGEVADVLQVVKDNPKFARRLLSLDGKTFPTWKTVTLGTFKDVKSLKQALKENGFRIGDWASDIMNQPSFSLVTEKIDINLVVLSVADLGFPEGATYGEICKKAKELGLHLCPAEVGPALRYQYPDQPSKEWLVVAMEAITDSDGYPDVFRVVHGRGDRWLSARWGSPGRFWHAGSQFVFLGK